MGEIDLIEGHEFDLSSLFKEGIKFRIPIYQRNYAWGEQEINRLLIDIKNNKADKYYLGTLVLCKNGDYYDVIDGQQRLTTLFLLLQWLGKGENKNGLTINELHFESRPKVKSFINLLKEKHKQNEVLAFLETFEELKSFTSALSVIHKFFDQVLKKEELVDFINNCLTNTYIFATALPEKTNVNHYFEIMNNRGEQLEKHEILKAQLLKQNELCKPYNKAKFAQIWDACSQMDNHVQYYFDSEIKIKLFGESYNRFPATEIVEEFLQVSNKNDNDASSCVQKEDDVKSKASYILLNHKIDEGFQQTDQKNKDGKLKAIINFENFLLHALNLCVFEDVNLDDKNLLENFEAFQNKDDFSINFIIKLLQTRFLFDKYVIKREIDENSRDWDWSIKDFEKSENSFVQNNTFDSKKSKQLVMLQSMFQVSYSANTNKTWLKSLLKSLFENKNANGLYKHLYKLMKKRFNDSNLKDSQGLQTPRAVFNFLDFLLWDAYDEKIKGNSDNQYVEVYLNKINKELRYNFSNFKFTQRNSIEHLFPQSKIKDLKMKDNSSEEKEAVLNSFGNLCLISSSSNSSYNKEHPIFKKSKATGKNESLKQQIMFSMIENNKWGQEEIEKHNVEMMFLLNEKLNNADNHA